MSWSSTSTAKWFPSWQQIVFSHAGKMAITVGHVIYIGVMVRAEEGTNGS